MRLPRWIENRLDFLAKESVYGRGLDTGVFIGRQHRELEIIKLLELEQYKQGDNWEATTANEIIALIKGEK